ncbi:MAG: nicotinate phosphoribosyltransferase [Nitrospinae bacterium]|nr:nicotinate phosphoribosyltransferase [Nitrospinota bacterium]
MPFHIASEADIKSGRVTDSYFARTLEVLTRKGVTKRAKAEVVAKGLPDNWPWGILAGLEELAHLLQGLPVDVWCMAEGTLFFPYEPVLVIEGRYLDYAAYETALLGLLCHPSGIASKAARCKQAAHDKPVISFGARRAHPVIAPMIERNAFIGGCDGVATLVSAELLGIEASGTVPHALILMFGDVVEAMKAFNEVIDPKVRRVALVDTLFDEKIEAVRVAEALGEDLFAVRLDTPASRRGDMRRILEEVRWELDYRGFKHVKLYVSGGLDEHEIGRLHDLADGYGVGTSISSAPVVNFALDIVEVEGQPFAKRWKMSGSKQVYRCATCCASIVRASHDTGGYCPCGGTLVPLLEPFIQQGALVRELLPPEAIRAHVLTQLARVDP